MIKKIIWVLAILVLALTIYGGIIEYRQSVTIKMPLDQLAVQPTEEGDNEEDDKQNNQNTGDAKSTTWTNNTGSTAKTASGTDTTKDIAQTSGNKTKTDTARDAETKDSISPDDELSYKGWLIPNQASDSAASSETKALIKLWEKDIAAFKNMEASDIVFDTCGDSKKYTSQARYKDLSTQLLDLWWGIIEKDGILKSIWWETLEFCFSTPRNQVIVNVPSWINIDEKSCKANENDDLSYCIDALTIFSYDTTTKTLEQAKKDPETIIYKKDVPTADAAGTVSMHAFNDTRGTFQHASPAIILNNGFGKRLWSYIGMSSSYSEGWCFNAYQWKYDYSENTITLAGSTNGCE